MGPVIAWRNPRPVQTIQRCTRITKDASCARYFVEELIGGELQGEWIDSATMEIRRRENIPEPSKKKPVVNASGATKPKRRKPAIKVECKAHR
jgi:hypothetical protein